MVKDIILSFYKKNLNDITVYAEARKQVFDTLMVDQVTGKRLVDNNILANPEDEKNNAIFIPSVVYMFLYPFKDGILNEYSFVDYIPMVLCTSVAKDKITGINLNFMTPEKRAFFLNSLWNTNSEFYYESVYTDKRTEIINKKLAEALLNNLNDFIKYENSYLNMDITKAFRTYDISKIKNSRYVGYYLWEYLPFVQVKESIKGSDLEKIQEMVCKSKE